MTISLGNALSAIKEDEKWVKKLLIGGFVYLAVIIGTVIMERHELPISTRLIGAGVYLIFGAFLSGFIVSTGNKMLNSGTNAMTEWTEKNLLLKGLKFIFSYIVYVIVLTTIFAIIACVLLLLATLVLGLLYYVVSLLLHIDCHSVAPVFAVIYGVLTLVFMLWYVQFFNAAQTCYFKKLHFRDFMAFKKHFRIIKENAHATWSLLGKEVLYFLLFILMCVIAFITIVGILALPFIYFVAYITITNLYAQYGREIQIERYFEE